MLHAMPASGGLKTTRGSWFSPPTTWIPGTEVRFSGLMSFSLSHLTKPHFVDFEANSLLITFQSHANLRKWPEFLLSLLSLQKKSWRIQRESQSKRQHYASWLYGEVSRLGGQRGGSMGF